MSFDASMINDVDESTIEPESASGSRYPMIQWGYGSPKLAAKLGGVEGNGGFFLPESNIKDEELKPALLKAGWVADTVTYENGKKNPGYYIDTLTFVLVNYRQRWEYKDDTDKTFYYTYDWKEWNRAKEIHGANPKSRIHGYIIIKGLEAFSPFVITLGGSGAMAFTGTKDVPGVLNTFEATVRAAAKKLTGKLWPNRAFWLTVSTAKDKKGVAQFTKVGKDPKTTYVCLPVPVGLPDPKVFVDQIKENAIDLNAFLDKFSIERDVFGFIQELYPDSEEWKSQWKSFNGENTDASPATNGKAAVKVADSSYAEEAGV